MWTVSSAISRRAPRPTPARTPPGRSPPRSAPCAGSCRPAGGPRQAGSIRLAAKPAEPGSTLTAPARQARAGREQRQHRAAEAAAHDAGAERAGLPAGLHGALDLGHRDLVVVAQAAVRGVEQARRPRRGRRRSSAATVASTRSFSEMTCRTRRSSGSGRPALAGRVAQRVDPERSAGRAALLAALVVAGVGREVARRAGVEHGQQVVRAGRAGRCAARVRACRCARLGRARRTARRAGRAARCGRRSSRSPRASTGARAAIRSGGLGSGDRAERQAERDETAADEDRPAPQREVAGDRRGGRRAARCPSRCELARRRRGRSARQPSAAPLPRAKLEAVALAQVVRVRLDRGAGSGLGGHRDAALDGEREAETVVVVGVLADQVDPARERTPGHSALRRGACSRRVFEWRI